MTKPLPTIKVVKETEVTCYDLELEMDDDTHDKMVKWGKEVATDQDYVNIAFIAGLTDEVQDDSESLNKHET
jgi:hypothetical protein